jgi:hypothetical protein
VALQFHPQHSTGPIISHKRWPATSGAAPILDIVPAAPLAINLGQSRVAATTAGPISYVVRFPYTSGAAPVFVPGFDDPSPPEELSKWLSTYPDRIDRRELHAAYIPHTGAWHVITPLNPDGFGWYAPPSEPVRQNNIPIAVIASGLTRTNMRVEIQPAMWLPVYPSYLPRRHYTNNGQQSFISLELSTVLPRISAWMAVYPDFIHTRTPIHHLAPTHFNDPRDPNSFIPKLAEWAATYPEFARTLKPNQFWQVAWFGPDTERLDQPTEVEDGFVWFMQQPDFARGRPIVHHLAPVTWWHTITGPDVRRPSKRGGLLLMKVGS